jgi:hypothetical protein
MKVIIAFQDDRVAGITCVNDNFLAQVYERLYHADKQELFKFIDMAPDSLDELISYISGEQNEGENE